MRTLLGLWRLSRVVLHVLSGLWIIRVRFQRLSAAQQEETVQAWAHRMLGILGIRLELHGQPVMQGPALLVCNHISWADILVLHAARHCRFVAKADVRRWPFLGAMATGAGTLYIERESRRDALRTVHRMADSLRAGEVVAIFPESTTSNGIEMLPFHSNLIQAAVSANAPIQPIGLRFVEPGTRRTSLAPCFIGDDPLISSLWRTVRSGGVVARVAFGSPEYANGRDRRVWAQALRDEVDRLRCQGA